MPYKRSHRNIHRSVVNRAKRFMQAQPWLLTDSERCRIVSVFLEKALKSYGHEVNIVVRSASYSPSSFGYSFRRDEGDETTMGQEAPTYHVLFGARYTTPPVFTALRQIEREMAGEPVDAVDASDWANALLFTVAPHVFRKLARRGRLVGVRPIDTFSQENADLLHRYGYVLETGFLAPNYYPGILSELRADVEEDAAAMVQGHGDESDEDEEGVDEVDAQEETDAILADPGTMAALREADAELAEGSAGEPVIASDVAESPQEATDDLDGMNRDAVREEARRLGIRNVSAYNRQALVTMIRAARSIVAHRQPVA